MNSELKRSIFALLIKIISQKSHIVGIFQVKLKGGKIILIEVNLEYIEVLNSYERMTCCDIKMMTNKLYNEIMSLIRKKAYAYSFRLDTSNDKKDVIDCTIERFSDFYYEIK